MEDRVAVGFLVDKAKRKVAAIAIAFILVWSEVETAATAAEAEKLNVFYSSIAASSVVTWIPKEAGIYKKYGLDVNLIYAVGSQAITTLISGDTQIGQGSGAAAVLSRLSGSDVTIIGTPINVIQMSLVAAPDINKPQDLKGKTFGVSRFGSLTDIGLRKALNEFGLDASLDIKMIQTGGVPEILQFMQQGVVKGGVISSPTLERAKELGYKEFLNLGETKYRYPSTALVTTDSFIKSRPQTLNRFLKATLEGLKYSKENPDFSVRVLSKYTRNADTKLLMSAFKSTVLAYVRDVPDVTTLEMESVLEAIAAQNPKARGADPKQFYDPAPLEQVTREGFVKEIRPR